MGFLKGLLNGALEGVKNDNDWCLCPRCRSIMRYDGEKYVCEECGNDEDEYTDIWCNAEEDFETRDWEDY